MDDTDRFETWLSACPSMIYVVLIEGGAFVPVWVSPNIEHSFGYPRSDMLSNPRWWADHLHPEDHDRVLSGVGKLFEDGHLVHEYRFEHADGTYRHVRDELRLTPDEHGDLTQVVGSWADITDTKRVENLADKLAREVAEHEETEQRLRLSEEVYRDLVEGSLEGIGIISREGKPLFANRALVRIHGFDTVAEVLALDSIEELVAPNERQRLRDYMATRSGGGEVSDTYEYTGLRKDGTPIWLENTVRVIEWNGELCLQGTLIDVTERKRWQAELEESEERYRLLVDQAPDAI
ncbi:MAG: PAS domain S-box protein, partial [Proteobacteria bacterium]|nr:PAS domain S-box protein [Pseudomonadota bacterium]